VVETDKIVSEALIQISKRDRMFKIMMIINANTYQIMTEIFKDLDKISNL